MSTITFRRGMMGGEATINGQRLTAAAINALMTDRQLSDERIIALYPFLTVEDLDTVRWFYETYRIVHRRKRLPAMHPVSS